MEREWARSADDILWRRSKLGLRLNAGQVQALDSFVRERLAGLLANAGREDGLMRAAG
jgi:glycerol-3-phosphate dehydrogenase